MNPPIVREYQEWYLPYRTLSEGHVYVTRGAYTLPEGHIYTSLGGRTKHHEEHIFLCIHLLIDVEQKGSGDHLLVITFWRPRGLPPFEIINPVMSIILYHTSILD